MNYAINFYDKDGTFIENVSVAGRVPIVNGTKIVNAKLMV